MDENRPPQVFPSSFAVEKPWMREKPRCGYSSLTSPETFLEISVAGMSWWCACSPTRPSTPRWWARNLVCTSTLKKRSWTWPTRADTRQVQVLLNYWPLTPVISCVTKLFNSGASTDLTLGSQQINCFTSVSLSCLSHFKKYISSSGRKASRCLWTSDPGCVLWESDAFCTQVCFFSSSFAFVCYL